MTEPNCGTILSTDLSENNLPPTFVGDEVGCETSSIGSGCYLSIFSPFSQKQNKTNKQKIICFHSKSKNDGAMYLKLNLHIIKVSCFHS